MLQLDDIRRLPNSHLTVAAEVATTVATQVTPSTLTVVLWMTSGGAPGEWLQELFAGLAGSMSINLHWVCQDKDTSLWGSGCALGSQGLREEPWPHSPRSRFKLGSQTGLGPQVDEHNKNIRNYKK